MAERPTVVAIGDSLTLGVGDGTQHPTGDVGWAAHTAYALNAVTFTNLAANGARARDLVTAQVPAAIAANPHVILASAGGNDVLRGDFDAAEVERELRGALETLASPDRRIVVLAIDRIGLFDLLPAPSPPSWPAGSRRRTRRSSPPRTARERASCTVARCSALRVHEPGTSIASTRLPSGTVDSPLPRWTRWRRTGLQ